MSPALTDTSAALQSSAFAPPGPAAATPAPSSAAESEFEHGLLPGDGVRLHGVVAGPPAGELVILLHGFPEFWYEWRRYIRPLAAAGYRVVALDQRGYNRSDKPGRVRDYTADVLARDVVAVIEGLGRTTAAVVGHDWGGGVGWWLALNHPARVSKLAVMNCPHPLAMQAALEGNWGQILRSWYIFAAQVPGLPEAAARWTNYGFLERSMRRTSRPGTFTDDDMALYRRAWAEPGAVTAMINWYRAAVRHPPPEPPSYRVRVPTLLLWGIQDVALGRDLAPASVALCDAGRLTRFPSATHWLPHEEPEHVGRLLTEFLRAP